MAHDLAITNGRPAMAFYGLTPWHGLGTKLPAAATSAEAIRAAGLDYEVELHRLTTEDGLPVPKRLAVVRGDTLDVLGTVGGGYTPIQNRAAFDFLDALVEEGELRYHTAGALGRGERVWMLAKLPGEVRVAGEDVSEKFLLLANSHDGSSSPRVFFTPVRVVCQNTLNLALRQRGAGGVSIVHRGDLRDRVEQAQQVLGLAHRTFERYGEAANALAQRSLTPSEAEDYFFTLYPDRPGEQRGRARALRHRLLGLFEEGLGQDLPGVRGTAWAAVNAVTEFVDHHRTTRGRDPRTRADRRLASAWFGSGALIKQRAWEQALALAP